MEDKKEKMILRLKYLKTMYEQCKDVRHLIAYLIVLKDASPSSYNNFINGLNIKQ